MITVNPQDCFFSARQREQSATDAVVRVISKLNHYTAINCRAITGCPYGTNQSPVGTGHNSPEIHFREILP